MRNLIIILLISITSHAAFGQSDLEAYLNDNCPDSVPEIFLHGIVSDKHHEHSSPSFDFDNKIIYWTTVIDSTNRHTIMQTAYKDERFLTPTIAPFSGKYKDFKFELSEESSFLCSKRPRHDNENISVGIWVIDKKGKSWEEPKPFHFKNDSNSYGYRFSTYNPERNRLYLGTMYSDNIDGEFSYPKQKESLNHIYSDKQDWMFFTSHDEDYMIFSSNRDGGYGSFDLYICFKILDNQWTKPINMGDKINTKRQERCPGVTKDGKYFFFTRPNPPNKDDIWWVSTKIIENLRGQIINSN